jgi:hypothetical protein
MKSPGDIPVKPAGRCPFGHDAPKPEPVESEPEPTPKLESPWNNWGNGNKPHTPYDWTKDEKVQGETGDAAKAETKPDLNSFPSHVTFNGPVFFGYSAEQTASLMQQLGQLGKS